MKGAVLFSWMCRWSDHIATKRIELLSVYPNSICLVYHNSNMNVIIKITPKQNKDKLRRIVESWLWDPLIDIGWPPLHSIIFHCGISAIYYFHIVAVVGAVVYRLWGIIHLLYQMMKMFLVYCETCWLDYTPWHKSFCQYKHVVVKISHLNPSWSLVAHISLHLVCVPWIVKWVV